MTEAGELSGHLHNYLSAYLPKPGDEGAVKLVFAVGGDGTVRACAHELAGTGVPLAILPRGTANLFAHALGVPTSLGAALAMGFGSSQRAVDLAFTDGQPFVAMAGIGVDAAVVAATPRWSKHLFGWAGYALAALRHLGGPLSHFSLRLDGGEPVPLAARGIVIGNVGALPGGFTLMPGASITDGVLDVGILSPRSLIGWADIARRVVAGREGMPGLRNFAHLRASHVEVTAAQPLPRQFDGDPMLPGCSLEARVAHGALLVRAPHA